MAEEKIIIDLQVDTEKMQKGLSLAMSRVASLKESQKNLRKEIEAGNDKTGELAATYAEYSKQLEQAQREIKSNTAALQLSTAAMVDENSSLDEQRQLLNAAQKAYAQLSGEAKKSADAEGGLADQIKHLSDVVKEQEMSVGDARRNVGNYAESVQDAFGNIAKSAGDLAPAVSVLRSMGGEGKKLGDALDMVGKVMQLVGKAGQQVATAMKAQTVATNAQTTAQGTLNTVMAANPIGLIIAGISTLIPLIQAFCNNTKDAETAQKAFNEQAEAYNQILAQRGQEEDFELEEMKIMGATELELAKQRQENRKRDYNEAVAYYNNLNNLRQKAHDAGKRKLEEEYETQLAEQQKVVDKTRLAWKKAADAVALEQLRITQKAIADSDKLNAENTKRADDLARGAAASAYNTANYIREGLQKIGAMATQMQKELHDNTVQQAKETADKITQIAQMPAPDISTVARLWGLDDAGLAYLQDQVNKGVDIIEAADKAVSDQFGRTVGGFADSLGRAASGFGELGDLMGEFADQSEDAARAQKAFALTSILINQALSISEGAKGIASAAAGAASAAAASGPLAPILLPIYTASMIAEIVGVMGSVASTIVQAKQLFSQADTQKFAQGGIVGGSSYSGDHVPVMANSGEMYLNRESQQELFDVLKSPTGKGIGIDYEMMAAAMASVPAPVVVYTELEQFGERVSTYNEIASV